jgi:ubiquinone/menaquinone biosynthesis C-methylase UbiE
VNSEQQFDRQAAHYNASWNAWSESSLQWLLDHAAPQLTDRVLDVATGTGFTALSFAPLVQEVVGIDVSAAMLEQAGRQANSRSITNVRWRQAPAEQLPFDAETFDLVTARVAPHHFENLREFIAESFRVLRSGGRFLIADTSVPDALPEVDQWQNRVEWLRDRSHIRNYSPGAWRQFTSEAGYEVGEVGRCDEAHPILLYEWMNKSGCSGEAADEVARLFSEAPDAARREFSIQTLPDGNYSFKWMRVVLAARKP